jgi:hypothetical protein
MVAVRGGWERFCNEQPHGVFSVTKVVNGRRMICVGYVTLGRYEYRTLEDLGIGKKVILINGCIV